MKSFACKTYIVLVLLCTLAFLYSCQTFPNQLSSSIETGKSSLAITNFQWTVLNYSTKSSMKIGPGTLGLKLLFHFNEQININNYSEINISFSSSPNKKWNLMENEYAAIGDNYITIRIFNDDLSKFFYNVGKLQITFYEKNGKSFSFSNEMLYSTKNSEIKIENIFTEDYLEKPIATNLNQALKRAVSISAEKLEHDKFLVKFIPTDKRSINGQILFFDKDNTHIGYTNNFVSFDNGVLKNLLLKNKDFEVGLLSEIEVDTKDIHFIRNGNFGQIDRIAVFLTDKEPETDWFNFASISDDALILN